MSQREANPKRLERYRSALRSCRKSGGKGARALVRLKMLAQADRVSYGEHESACATERIDESLLTDAHGRSIQDWFGEREGQAGMRCPSCGMTGVNEHPKCLHCGGKVPKSNRVPLVRVSAKSRQKWDRLRRGPTYFDRGLILLGLLLLCGAGYLAYYWGAF